ncbi:MAG: hypothetical protein ACREXT_20180 [Gammaproteobacteria bacterium]
MNANFFEPVDGITQDPEHLQTWPVLPWYVNRSLSSAEAARTEKHVKGCLVCRRELDALRVLAQYTAAPHFDLECENALRRLSSRLDPRALSSRHAPWAAAAMLSLVTGLLGWVANNTETSTAWLRNAGYSLLNEQYVAQASIDGPQVRLVFYDDITERQLRSLVLAVGGAVVEGPTPQGVYTLAFARDTSPSEVMEAIQKLRYSRGVVFAEQAMPTKVSETGNW